MDVYTFRYLRQFVQVGCEDVLYAKRVYFCFLSDSTLTTRLVRYEVNVYR